MQFLIRLPDGRDLQDEAAQVIATDAIGHIKLMAYVVPESVVVCGHYREDTWAEFLRDAGYHVFEQLNSAKNHLPGIVCRLQTDQGMLTLRTTVLRVYSNNGDPLAAAVWDAQRGILCCHCGDDDWNAFCKRHKISSPRELTVVEID